MNYKIVKTEKIIKTISQNQTNFQMYVFPLTVPIKPLISYSQHHRKILIVILIFFREAFFKAGGPSKSKVGFNKV